MSNHISVDFLKSEKAKLEAKVEELDQKIRVLKENEAKLFKENSQNRSQISRLKLEVKGGIRV